MKICLTSLIIREMQIKTTMRYHFTPVRMAIINKSINNSVGEGVEKRELSCTIGGNADWCSHYEKQFGDSSKKLKIELPSDPTIPLLGIYPKKFKTLILKDNAPLCSLQCYNSQDTEATQGPISRWVDKKVVVHIYNAIFPDCEK